MLALAGLPSTAEDAAQPEEVAVEPEVTVIKSGGTVMYRYRDESGQIVIQDTPPAEYFDQPEVSAEDKEAEERKPIPLLATEPTPAPLSFGQRAVRAVRWLLSFALLVGGLYLLAAPAVRARLLESSLARMLRKAGFPAFFDVAVTSGSRSHAEVDCLARTPSGILVLGVVAFDGQVTGRHDEVNWIVTNKDGTDTVHNPLLKNMRDTRLVQELLDDVPVHGRVVYSGHAKFASGKPARLQSVAALRENLDHFTVGRRAQKRSLEIAWRTLMRFPRSNVEPPRGAGWQGWLRRHWHAVAGAVLISLSATSTLALILNGGVA